MSDDAQRRQRGRGDRGDSGIGADEPAQAQRDLEDVPEHPEAIQAVPNSSSDEEEDEMPDPIINANQLAILGEFKGEDDEDVEAFMLLVSRCRTSFQWEQNSTSSMVQTCLKGAAARWLRSLLKTSAPDDQLDVWEHVVGGQVVAAKGLKHFMMTRFKEGLNERGAVEAVMDLRQKTGESVCDFYDRVVLGMDRKNYRATAAEKLLAPYREKLTQDTYTFFAAGLLEDIRRQALGGPVPPDNANDLLKAARNAELERRKATAKPKFLNEMQVEGAAGGAAVEATAAQGDLQIEELRAELEALKASISGSANVECWSCGRKGHFAFNCPIKGKGVTRRGGFRGRGRGAPRGGTRRVYLRPVTTKKSGYSPGAKVTPGRGKKMYELVDEDEDDDEDEYGIEEMIDEGDLWAWNDPNGL